jgi:hypothetical protein
MNSGSSSFIIQPFQKEILSLHSNYYNKYYNNYDLTHTYSEIKTLTNNIKQKNKNIKSFYCKKKYIFSIISIISIIISIIIILFLQRRKKNILLLNNYILFLF